MKHPRLNISKSLLLLGLLNLCLAYPSLALAVSKFDFSYFPDGSPRSVVERVYTSQFKLESETHYDFKSARSKSEPLNYEDLIKVEYIRYDISDRSVLENISYVDGVPYRGIFNTTDANGKRSDFVFFVNGDLNNRRYTEQQYSGKNYSGLAAEGQTESIVIYYDKFGSPLSGYHSLSKLQNGTGRYVTFEFAPGLAAQAIDIQRLFTDPAVIRTAVGELSHYDESGQKFKIDQVRFLDGFKNFILRRQLYSKRDSNGKVIDGPYSEIVEYNLDGTPKSLRLNYFNEKNKVVKAEIYLFKPSSSTSEVVLPVPADRLTITELFINDPDTGERLESYRDGVLTEGIIKTNNNNSVYSVSYIGGDRGNYLLKSQKEYTLINGRRILSLNIDYDINGKALNGSASEYSADGETLSNRRIGFRTRSAPVPIPLQPSDYFNIQSTEYTYQATSSGAQRTSQSIFYYSEDGVIDKGILFEYGPDERLTKTTYLSFIGGSRSAYHEDELILHGPRDGVREERYVNGVLDSAVLLLPKQVDEVKYINGGPAFIYIQQDFYDGLLVAYSSDGKPSSITLSNEAGRLRTEETYKVIDPSKALKLPPDKANLQLVERESFGAEKLLFVNGVLDSGVLLERRFNHKDFSIEDTSSSVKFINGDRFNIVDLPDGLPTGPDDTGPNANCAEVDARVLAAEFSNLTGAQLSKLRTVTASVSDKKQKRRFAKAVKGLNKLRQQSRKFEKYLPPVYQVCKSSTPTIDESICSSPSITKNKRLRKKIKSVRKAYSALSKSFKAQQAQYSALSASPLGAQLFAQDVSLNGNNQQIKAFVERTFSQTLMRTCQGLLGQ